HRSPRERLARGRASRIRQPRRHPEPASPQARRRGRGVRDPGHSRRRIRLRGHHLSSHSLEHRLARIQKVLALGLVLLSGSSSVIARPALRPPSRITSQPENTPWDAQARRFGSAGDPAEIGALAGSFDRLLERLDEILRAERNFTQDAAHELRTPLTVLCGEIEYAVQDPSMPPHIRDGLDRALQQARAMSDLVEALLLLLQGPDPEPKARGELAQPCNLSY